MVLDSKSYSFYLLGKTILKNNHQYHDDKRLHALSFMAILLSTFPNLGIPTNTKSFFSFTSKKPIICSLNSTSKRHLILQTSLLCVGFGISLTPQPPIALSSPSKSNSLLSKIENTKSWFQFFGDGFAIRVPPEFQDIMEPEDFSAGLALYGDRAKEKKFVAQFASSDGNEVLNVVIRPASQLKITFLEAQDITDFGSLKETADLFVPGGATVYSARSIKIKEEDSFRTYYFYEFGKGGQHAVLMATVKSGKAIIAGATAPQSMWDTDGVKLRSAAVSLTIL